MKKKKNVTIELKLYDLMQQRGMTVEQLAKKTGMSRQGLYYLLNRPPSSIYMNTLAQICAALDVDPGTLLILKEVPK